MLQGTCLIKATRGLLSLSTQDTDKRNLSDHCIQKHLIVYRGYVGSDNSGMYYILCHLLFINYAKLN